MTKLSGWFALISLLLGALSDAAKPDILLIVSEDNGPELGCYGDPYVQTPVLDRLAALTDIDRKENRLSFPVGRIRAMGCDLNGDLWRCGFLGGMAVTAPYQLRGETGCENGDAEGSK